MVPWHVPTDTWWSWALLLVVVDLAWYCNHRFSHRVRIGWAGHQAHHSSQYFNFATALRQKWNISGDVFLRYPAKGLTARTGRVGSIVEACWPAILRRRFRHGFTYCVKLRGARIAVLWGRSSPASRLLQFSNGVTTETGVNGSGHSNSLDTLFPRGPRRQQAAQRPRLDAN